MGQQGTLKVLLNQESPHTVARAMAYYRYFFQARNELVVTYRATLAELAAVAARSEAAARQLGEQQAELQSQQEAQLASRAEREQAIAALATNIRNKDDELQQLERDREELEQLLESIKQAIVEIELPADYKPFASRKGSMTWPVDARRNNSFGASRGLGGMRWQGINLTADEGSTVRAIHHGRVVFADWLRGSGLRLHEPLRPQPEPAERGGGVGGTGYTGEHRGQQRRPGTGGPVFRNPQGWQAPRSGCLVPLKPRACAVSAGIGYTAHFHLATAQRRRR